ncbi:MAG: MoxR family ATPase [Acidobacteria bacterium]|nr:MoxR family ATPase [Acidobacteriota bacterium]
MSEALFTGAKETRSEPELPPPLEPQLRSTGRYVPGAALQAAVEVALLLGQPLLVTGEPGTGKSTLARALAYERFQSRYLEMQVKSTSARDDLLYRIDDVRRFRDAQLRRENPMLNYLELRPFGEAIVRACGPDAQLLDRSGRNLTGGEAFLDDMLGPHRLPGPPTARLLLPNAPEWTGPERWVVLIDEIDKAPRDTPNDLLEEFEKLAFAMPELGLRVAPSSGDAAIRPVVIVTSNSEKSLPHAFLRRCAYHHIPFPSDSELRTIIAERLGELNMAPRLLGQLLALFEQFRKQMRQRPGTAELLQWLKRADEDEELVEAADRPSRAERLKRLVCIIAKDSQDQDTANARIDAWARGE